MTAYGRLHLILVNIATLHNQFIPHHDGRRRRQPQPGIFLGTIVLKGFGYGLDFHLVLFPQPGDNYSEMPSGLAAGFVNENSQFQHAFLSFPVADYEAECSFLIAGSNRYTIKGRFH
jgi:hypothetical protein